MLVIWRERDPAFGINLLDCLEQVAPNLYIHRIPDVRHWARNEVLDEAGQVLVCSIPEPQNCLP